MIATISNPVFADLIISRYIGGQPGLYAPADMVLALSPKLPEQPSSFAKNVRNITLINRCINENLTVNLNAHLCFLANILGKTVLEMREGQTRQIMMLQKQLSVPPAIRAPLAPGHTDSPAKAGGISPAMTAPPGHTPAQMLTAPPPIPERQPSVIRQLPVFRQHPRRDDPKSPEKKPDARQPEPPETPRDTRRSAQQPPDRQTFLTGPAFGQAFLALMRAERHIPVWHRSLLEIPGESGVESMPGAERSSLYAVNIEAQARAEFHSPPLIQRTTLPPPAEDLPPSAIRPASQSAGRRAPRNVPAQRETTAHQDIALQKAEQPERAPVIPHTQAAERPRPAPEPAASAERVLPRPPAFRPESAWAKRERADAAPVRFSPAMLRQIAAQLSDRPAGQPLSSPFAARIVYRDPAAPDAESSVPASTAGFTVPAGMPRAAVLRRLARSHHPGQPFIPGQTESGFHQPGTDPATVPLLWQTAQPADSPVLSGNGIIVRRPAMAAAKADFIQANPDFAPDSTASGPPPAARTARQTHAPMAQRDFGHMTGMPAAQANHFAAERKLAWTVPENAGLAAMPDFADRPQTARERIVFRDRPPQKAEAATIIHKRASTPEPPQNTNQAASPDIEFIKKTVQQTDSSKSMTANKAINLPGTTIKPLPAGAEAERQVNEIADRVYRALERRLRSEHMRKGLL